MAALREARYFLVDQGLATQRACALRQRQRSTFYDQARPDRNAAREHQVRKRAQDHPRYGYRRIGARVRRERVVHTKRMHRVWKRSRLQVGKRPRKRRRRVAPGEGRPIKAPYPGHVWTYDFVHDPGLNGTPLNVLTVMDEVTRAGVALALATSLPSEPVRVVRAGLVTQHAAPAHLRSAPGPEVIAQALRTWRAHQHPATVYIDPGSPWQHGSGERCTGTVRDECRKLYACASVVAARVILEQYRHEYNAERPHRRLGYRTPAECKRDWRNTQSSTADSTIPT